MFDIICLVVCVHPQDLCWKNRRTGSCTQAKNNCYCVYFFQLPFALIPVLHFTGDKAIMKSFQNGRYVELSLYDDTTLVIVLIGFPPFSMYNSCFPPFTCRTPHHRFYQLFPALYQIITVVSHHLLAHQLFPLLLSNCSNCFSPLTCPTRHINELLFRRHSICQEVTRL